MNAPLDDEAPAPLLADVAPDHERRPARHGLPVADRQLARDDADPALGVDGHAHGLIEERSLNAAVDDSRRAVEVRGRHVVDLDALLGLEETKAQALRVVGSAPEAGGTAEGDLSAHGGGLCHTRGPTVAGHQTARPCGTKRSLQARIA